MPFTSPDPSVIRTWGETVQHKPGGAGGDPVDVKLVREDPRALNAQGALLVFFGTVADSGFIIQPVEGDQIVADGKNYRVYDVKSDWAGGSPETAGLWLYLDLAE